MAKKSWWAWMAGSDWWGGKKLKHGTRYGPFKTMREAKSASVGKYAKMKREGKGSYFTLDATNARVWFGGEDDEGY